MKKFIPPNPVWLQKWLGKPKSTDNASRQSSQSNGLLPLTDLPTPQQLIQRIELFPPSCRQVFIPDPLTANADALLIGRTEERKALQHLLSDWRRGTKTPIIALVGGYGSGKTSLLGWLQGQRRSTETVIRVNANRRLHSKEEIIEWLGRSMGEDPLTTETALAQGISTLPGCIILLDNTYGFTLRTLGIADRISSLMEIVLGTRDTSLWVMAFEEQTWRRLDYQFSFSQYFTDVIRLPHFSQGDFEAMLDLRLQQAALNLTTVTDGDESQEQKSRSQVIKRCASNLFDLSGGNATAALYHWILHARYNQIEGTLAFEPGQRLDLSPLANLDRDQQFTLAELLTNGGLTLQEHQEIFQYHPMESRLLLNQLQIMGLLIRQEEHGLTTFQINPILHKPIVTALINANLLY